MKQVLVMLLAITLLWGLVSCDPATNYLEKDVLIENTINIKLFEYENNAPKLLRLSGKEKPRFDLSKATCLGTLDKSHFEDILSEIAEKIYTDHGTALNEPMGRTLVLYQKNGHMIVLFGCVYENEKGQTYYYGDCYEFDAKGGFVAYIGRVGHLFGDQIASTYFQIGP